jgi:hypothetical protein
MYVDTYLTWLEHTEKTPTGWPTWVTPDAQEWLVARVKETLAKYGPLPIDELYRLAWKRHDDQPECLRGAKIWDAIYGTLYRALLFAGAGQVFKLEPKKTITGETARQTITGHLSAAGCKWELLEDGVIRFGHPFQCHVHKDARGWVYRTQYDTNNLSSFELLDALIHEVQS